MTHIEHVHSEPPAFYTVTDIRKRATLSPATTYRFHETSDFPAPVRLSKRRFRWRADDVHAWMQRRVADRAEYAPHAPIPIIASDDAFLTQTEICARTALSREVIHRLEKAHAFPVRIRITLQRIAWLKSEIDAWITATAPSRQAKQNAAPIIATPAPTNAPEPDDYPTNPFMTF